MKELSLSGVEQGILLEHLCLSFCRVSGVLHKARICSVLAYGWLLGVEPSCVRLAKHEGQVDSRSGLGGGG